MRGSLSAPYIRWCRHFDTEKPLRCAGDSPLNISMIGNSTLNARTGHHPACESNPIQFVQFSGASAAVAIVKYGVCSTSATNIRRAFSGREDTASRPTAPTMMRWNDAPEKTNQPTATTPPAARLPVRWTHQAPNPRGCLRPDIRELNGDRLLEMPGAFRKEFTRSLHGLLLVEGSLRYCSTHCADVIETVGSACAIVVDSLCLGLLF